LQQIQIKLLVKIIKIYEKREFGKISGMFVIITDV